MPGKAPTRRRPSGGRDRRPSRVRPTVCWRSAESLAHRARRASRRLQDEVRRQQQGGVRAARWRAAAPVPLRPVRRWRAAVKAILSSSRSPSAHKTRGKMAASALSRSRNTERARRQARRVGQIKRQAGKFERIVRRREAGNEFAGAERVDEHRQKRRRGGNVEDVGRSLGFSGRHEANHTRSPGRAADQAVLARMAGFSASAMVSGVPTCIHSPSSRSPCRRRLSAARSNGKSEREFARGLPVNSAGDDRGAGIDEGHHLALATLARKRPSGAMT